MVIRSGSSPSKNICVTLSVRGPLIVSCAFVCSIYVKVVACVHHIFGVACYRVLCFFVFHICEGGGVCGDNICLESVSTVARVCVPPHM